MKINHVMDAGKAFLGKAAAAMEPAKEVAKKATVFAAAGAIAVSCAVPTAHAAADDIIDTTKTGTMHIRKYDMTAAVENGVDLSQFTANGEQDSDAEEVLANYELEGVQFSPKFAGEIATYSQEGTVILTYNIPSTLRTILELDASDAIWSNGDKLYYTSTQLNEAMQEGLRDNVNFKNKLEEWAATGALDMPLTDSRGRTSLSNLPLGLYLIVETKVPENVHTTVDPYFISLPSTDATGDHWFYTVYSYPKNQNNDPLLDKLVSEDGTYADTATVSEGDTLNYRLTSKLPTITSKATYLSEYTFTDELSKGLTYNKDVVISFYDNETSAKNATGENGLYYVTGQATEESGATRFSPASSGSLVIKGLEGDTYDLTEIQTDKGYSLLKGKITIEITPTVTSITPSAACLTGSDADHSEIAEVLTHEAFAIVDNTSANMSSDVNSANALVDLSIQNNRDFELPKTGGAGTWMITICGVVGVAGGVYLLRKGKRTAKRAK